MREWDVDGEWEGDRAIAFRLDDLHRRADGAPDRALRRPPQQADAGDVDDGPERQPPRAGLGRLAERDRPRPGQLPERGEARPPLDRARDALATTG